MVRTVQASDKPYVPAKGSPDQAAMMQAGVMPSRPTLAGILAAKSAPVAPPSSQLAAILGAAMPAVGSTPMLAPAPIAPTATPSPARSGGMLSAAVSDAFGGAPSAADTSGLPALGRQLADARIRKPGFFQHGGLGEKVGNFLFSMVTGMPPPGVRRHLEELAAKRQLLERVKLRQAERDEWVWREQWKRDHPDDQFTQYIQAAGIDPTSTQGQSLYRQRAESIAAPPMMAVDGFDPQGNPTKTFMPRTGMGGTSVPPAAGPAPGTVRNGYRFNGGNPNDRNSWVPIGGASPNGGATFR